MLNDETRDYYLRVLTNELERRRERNPLFSLRAYAKALQIDAGTLSRLVNGKQIPTYSIAVRLTRKLKLSTAEESEFFKSVSCASEKKIKQRPLNFWRSVDGAQIKDLDITLYEVISDWYHMAIMEMTYLENFVMNPKVIAKKLGITQMEAEQALNRLLSLGLIEVQNHTLIKKDKHLSTSQKNITTDALKRNQKQFLMKAVESLEHASIETRAVTSMTMAIDAKRLPVARKMIHDFNQALCKYLERGSRTRIYNLSIALNPLDYED